MLRELRCGDQRGGALLDEALAGEPLEPGADSGEGAGDGGFGEAAAVEIGEIRADMKVLDAGESELCFEIGHDEVGEVVEFALVGAGGVRARVALVREHGEEVVDVADDCWFGGGLLHGAHDVTRFARG